MGYALGQPLYGPITDRFGRKPPLYVSLLLFIFWSAACAVPPSIYVMSFFRLLQAVGACGGAVMSRAMVSDLFPASELRRIFSMLVLVLGVYLAGDRAADRQLSAGVVGLAGGVCRASLDGNTLHRGNALPPA